MTVTNKNDSTTISTSITGNTGTFTMPVADVSVSATFAALPISETYKKLSTEDGNEEYGCCVDVINNDIYLIYKLTADEAELASYDHIEVTKADGTKVTPKTSGADGADGEFKTIYKAINFGGTDELTADSGQYVIGFRVPETTDVPSFKITGVKNN